MRLTVSFRCNRCGSFIEKTFETEIGYVRDIVICRCGARYKVRATASLVSIPLEDLEKELEEYEKWLRWKKNILSAHQYARMVERRLRDPSYYPRVIAPLEYFAEYVREKYGKEKADKVRAFLLE